MELVFCEILGLRFITNIKDFRYHEYSIFVQNLTIKKGQYHKVEVIIFCDEIKTGFYN